MVTKADVLENIKPFAGLSDSERQLLERRAVVRTYRKGALIFSEGDTATALCIILSGSVKVFVSDENDKEMILARQCAGDYFGELALFDDALRSASVISLEKTTLWMLSKQDFREVLAQNPQVALSMIGNLVMKVRALTTSVKNLALLDVYGRVVQVLSGMAEQRDGRWVIEDRITQQEIADRVGASRERVSRILKELKRGGYVWQDGNHTIIAGHFPKHF